MDRRPVMLMILDGFGINQNEKGNAIAIANTPNIDKLRKTWPTTTIHTSGLDVGLPEGQMGNSEVGHTNIGAGRIVYQDLTRITKSIADGDFFSIKELSDAIENCKKNNSKLHIMGLLSDGGVHSHMRHLFAILEFAKRKDFENVYVHCFMDGRDTPPTSGESYIAKLEEKMKEKGVKAISEVVDDLPIDDKVIMVDVSDLLDSGLTGVVAIKIAEQYNKPCILLKKHFDKKTKTTVFGGSARNIDNSPIDSFKDIVNSTGFVNGKGHANAFGIVDLPVDDKEKAINMMNSILRDTEYDSTYRVDFILDINHVTIPLIIKLSQFEDIICQGIDEPMLAIENISLTRDCFEVFGKNEDTISFMMNDIKYIQFKCKEGNQLYDFLQNAWDDNDSITFNIVGKPSINEYNGIRTPQIIIEDVAVISTNSNDEDDDW
mgnify:CR=1 FL=1